MDEQKMCYNSGTYECVSAERKICHFLGSIFIADGSARVTNRSVTYEAVLGKDRFRYHTYSMQL